MGLEKKQGELRLTKSGRGIKFIDKSHVIGSYSFVASLEQVRELLAGKRQWVDFAKVVGDHEGV